MKAYREEQEMKHRPRFAVCLVAAITLLLTSSGIAVSQEITGSIVGIVKDQMGAAIKGASVTITDPATKQIVRTTTTNDDGAYTVRELHAQPYDITIESAGFKKQVATGVQVDVGKITNMAMTLRIGNVSQVVNVEAN